MVLWDNTGVTVELGELIRNGLNIWDFNYPVPRKQIEYNGKVAAVPFNKEELQKKIEKHYWFRQIGQETPARWLHYFHSRMQEIMPYFVQLYEFDAIFRNIEDPLESYNLLETFTQETQNTGSVSGQNSGTSRSERSGTNSRNGESTKNGSNDNLTKFSDTPQGSVSNLDSYLTTATQVNGSDTENISNSETGEETENVSGQSSGNSSQSSEDTGRVQHTLQKRGNIGVQPLGGEVENIRSAFINIDMQVIEALNDLFLQVY